MHDGYAHAGGSSLQDDQMEKILSWGERGHSFRREGRHEKQFDLEKPNMGSLLPVYRSGDEKIGLTQIGPSCVCPQRELESP